MKLFALIALVIPFLFAGCKKVEQAGDVSFAKSTFESLARGDVSVESKIDWETLNSLGTNVGAAYVIMESDVDKAEFRKGFITQFASSFRDGGGSVESFTNWRATEHDKLHTTVSADSPNGELRITVTTRDNVERVSGLEILK